MRKWFLWTILLVLWICPTKVFAEEVHLYLFYGNTCPVCEKERNYLKDLLPNYPAVKLFEFETYDNVENDVNMQSIKAMYHIRGEGVPFLVAGDIAIYGFGDGTPAKIESAIKKQMNRDYYDRVGVYLGYFEDEEIEEEIPEETSNVGEDQDIKEKVKKKEKKNIKWLAVGGIITFIGIGMYIMITENITLKKKPRK